MHSMNTCSFPKGDQSKRGQSQLVCEVEQHIGKGLHLPDSAEMQTITLLNGIPAMRTVTCTVAHLLTLSITLITHSYRKHSTHMTTLCKSVHQRNPDSKPIM